MNKFIEEKLYLGAGDINIINVISQKNQILIFKSYLSNQKSSIAYDVYENPETSHDLLRLQKISSQNKNKIYGIIFYSLIQLCYGKKIRLDLIEKFTKDGYKLIFFREDLIIKNLNDFKKQKQKISLFMDNNIAIINKFKNIS
tara:strand:+ start:6205 stop:6633 length:429 start_codon:yes stop_codon:yes gene_type:complete